MKLIVSIFACYWILTCDVGFAEDSVEYARDIAPLLSKYCVGCHNGKEAEADVRLDDWAKFPVKIDDSAFIVAGDPQASHLLAMIRGTIEPQMPPADEPQPEEAEVQRIEQWIAAGAIPPSESSMTIDFPDVAAAAGSADRVYGIDFAATRNWLALARFGRVDLVDATNDQVLQTIEGLPGKVNSVRFSPDERFVVVASGIAGVRGQVGVWDIKSAAFVDRWTTPDDTIYAVDITTDNQTIAAGGYDHLIRIWDRQDEQRNQTLRGHNGPIYALRFDPSGEVLATASGDETIKLWNVASGRRLDTLGQPLAEQYCVRFTADGKQVIGAGADNRIRVWNLASRKETKTSPLAVARFAHERPVVAIALNGSDSFLCTAAEDGSIKLWDRNDYRLLHSYPPRPLPVSGLEIVDDDKTLLASTLDGQLHRLAIPDDLHDSQESQAATPGEPTGTPSTQTPRVAESIAHSNETEPNDSLKTAQPLTWPAKVSGVIGLSADGKPEVDMFKIHVNTGDSLQLEVSAAQQKSPLDSYIEVLDAAGKPIPRIQLQAVRDSYFTFRGKNSTQTGDFRVHNWQEMELNEYLYSSGEVVRLWLYPRGPDSGFEVYPGFGNRTTYFGSTATSHALGEPAYIVRPLEIGAPLLPNGLPVFTLYFDNDDDPLRRWGSDSRLDFVAPATGEYFVRLRDSRGFGGNDYRYDLTVRATQPRFEVAIVSKNLKIRPGVGGEYKVRATRHDGFDGPIEVEIENVPEGFVASTPLNIQAGQAEAIGTIIALAGAKTPAPDAEPMRLFATATLPQGEVRQPVGELGKLEIAVDDSIVIDLLPIDHPLRDTDAPFELVIHPGETISAQIVAQRGDFKGVISFGKEDAGRNLPHGVYVDNIGLNGLMIPEGQSEREFFITAAPWVPETDRLFHLRATVKGNPTTRPILLKVRR